MDLFVHHVSHLHWEMVENETLDKTVLCCVSLLAD
jgi:hypothetical protein